MLVGLAELIADIGGNARLNSAGSKADQDQADQKHYSLANGDSPRRGHTRERQIAYAVNNRQRKDRPILAEKPVGENRADNWQKINAKHEQMRVHVGFVGI